MIIFVKQKKSIKTEDNFQEEMHLQYKNFEKNKKSIKDDNN